MKNRITACLLLLLVTLLSSCNGNTTGSKLELTFQMDSNYHESDPYINEKIIYVSEEIDTLDLDVSFQMKGEHGLLEIADNETGEVFWSNEWFGNVDKTEFAISLDKIETENEYVIRFTAVKLTNAKIVITSESSLVKEQDKP